MSIVLNYKCISKSIIEDKDFKRWISNIEIALSHYIKELNIKELRQFKESSFGIILEGSSNIGIIVMKLIPPQINRYQNEKRAYKLLSKKIMCPVIQFDDSINMILMKHCGKRIDSELVDEIIIKDFFLSVKENLLPFVHSDYSSSFPSYHDMLSKKMNNMMNNSIIEQHIRNAVTLYDRYFSMSPLFFLHGDLHYGNILILGDCIRAVDPIGYIAPEAFEYARFIGSELDKSMTCLSKYKTEEILSKWLVVFSTFCDNILEALYIDVAFRMHNTLIEFSSSYSFDRWLKIISFLERFL